jgi:hypothetical protein
MMMVKGERERAKRKRRVESIFHGALAGMSNLTLVDPQLCGKRIFVVVLFLFFFS